MKWTNGWMNKWMNKWTNISSASKPRYVDGIRQVLSCAATPLGHRSYDDDKDDGDEEREGNKNFRNLF